jgi:hypothetical protein
MRLMESTILSLAPIYRVNFLRKFTRSASGLIRLRNSSELFGFEELLPH